MLVTTLTKKMSEDLTDYLLEAGIRTRYLHSEVDTLRRIELLRELRLGQYDVLVGINLLREGLDLPEVSLVAILDADKEGFLRSDKSLIQTIGRAARNVSGQVVMYADKITASMEKAIDETNRRREKQVAYNTANGVDPQPLRKKIADITEMLAREDEDTEELLGDLAAPAGAAGKAPVPGLSSTESASTPPTSRGCPPPTWPSWSSSSPTRCTPPPPSCSSSSPPGCATRSRTSRRSCARWSRRGRADERGEVQVTFDCADPARRWPRSGRETLGYVLQPPPQGFATWDAALDAWGVPPDQRNDRSARSTRTATARGVLPAGARGQDGEEPACTSTSGRARAVGESRMAALEAEAERLVGAGGDPGEPVRARPGWGRPHRDAGPRGQRVLPRLTAQRSARASVRAAAPSAASRTPGSPGPRARTSRRTRCPRPSRAPRTGRPGWSRGRPSAGRPRSPRSSSSPSRPHAAITSTISTHRQRQQPGDAAQAGPGEPAARPGSRSARSRGSPARAGTETLPEHPARGRAPRRPAAGRAARWPGPGRPAARRARSRPTAPRRPGRAATGPARRLSVPAPLGGWKISAVTSGIASSTSSTRRYCTMVTTRSSAPRSWASATIPEAPPATSEKAPVAGRDVAVQRHQPAGDDADRQRADGDQQHRGPVGGEPGQGGELHQCADHRAHQRLPDPEQRRGQVQLVAGGQRVHHAADEGAEQHRRGQPQQREEQAGDDGHRQHDEPSAERAGGGRHRDQGRGDRVDV